MGGPAVAPVVGSIITSVVVGTVASKVGEKLGLSEGASQLLGAAAGMAAGSYVAGMGSTTGTQELAGQTAAQNAPVGVDLTKATTLPGTAGGAQPVSQPVSQPSVSSLVEARPGAPHSGPSSPGYATAESDPVGMLSRAQTPPPSPPPSAPTGTTSEGMVEAGTVGRTGGGSDKPPSFLERMFTPEKSMDLAMAAMQGYAEAGMAKEDREYAESVREKNAEGWEDMYGGYSASLGQPKYGEYP